MQQRSTDHANCTEVHHITSQKLEVLHATSIYTRAANWISWKGAYMDWTQNIALPGRRGWLGRLFNYKTRYTAAQ